MNLPNNGDIKINTIVACLKTAKDVLDKQEKIWSHILNSKKVYNLPK